MDTTSILSHDSSYDFYHSLSPCLSGETLDTGGPQICIVSSNLRDRWTVSLREVLAYTTSFLVNKDLDIDHLTSHHLVLYLYANKPETFPHIDKINQIRLLHLGTSHSITSLVSVSFPAVILERYTLEKLRLRSAVFQLSVVPEDRVPPFEWSSDLIYSKLMEVLYTNVDEYDDVPVTYAEAMVRLLRKAKDRKASVSSDDSIGRPATRVGSRNLVKEVERPKFRQRLKSLFH